MSKDTAVMTVNPGRIVLNETGWREALAQKDLHGDAAIARAMGMSKVTLWRVRTGRAEPGHRFIDTAQTLFEKPYSVLFKRVA